MSEAIKRNKKRVSGSRATNSFADMVGDAQIKKLHPYINQTVQQTVEHYMQVQQRQLVHTILEMTANMQVRQQALEELLLEAGTFTQKNIYLKMAQVEDRALQFTQMSEGAERGDCLRLAIQEDHGKLEYFKITSLGTKNSTGMVQTVVELEESLIGLKPEDYFEVIIPASQEGESDTPIKGQVLTVSRKLATEDSNESSK